ncbi:MAG TPA: hypothetical protein VL475_08135 [Planctomycetaceae bacterium]|nr:hypothetical protein [Planctomycetaceae bacterium]
MISRLFMCHPVIAICLWGVGLIGLIASTPWGVAKVAAPVRDTVHRMFSASSGSNYLPQPPDQPFLDKQYLRERRERRPIAFDESATYRAPVPETIWRRAAPQPAESKIHAAWATWASSMNLTAQQIRGLRLLLSRRKAELTPAQLRELPEEELQEVLQLLSAEQRERLSAVRESATGRRP